MGDAQQFGHAAGADGDLGLILAKGRRSQGKADVALDVQRGQKVEALKHHGHIAGGGMRLGDILPRHYHGPAVRRHQPRHGHQCGGLARAGRPQQRQRLARRHIKRESVKGAAGAVALAQFQEREQRGHGLTPARRRRPESASKNSRPSGRKRIARPDAPPGSAP